MLPVSDDGFTMDFRVVVIAVRASVEEVRLLWCDVLKTWISLPSSSFKCSADSVLTALAFGPLCMVNMYSTWVMLKAISAVLT